MCSYLGKIGTFADLAVVKVVHVKVVWDNNMNYVCEMHKILRHA